jgi:hypothetical protein
MKNETIDLVHEFVSTFLYELAGKDKEMDESKWN